MNIITGVRGAMQREVRTLTFTCTSCGKVIGTPLDDDELDVTSAECPYCHAINEFSNEEGKEV